MPNSIQHHPIHPGSLTVIYFTFSWFCTTVGRFPVHIAATIVLSADETAGTVVVVVAVALTQFTGVVGCAATLHYCLVGKSFAAAFR